MKSRWLILCGMVALALAVPALLPAQEAEPAAEEEGFDFEAEDVDVSGIEEILRGDQASLEGELFSYDPAGRRDPFRSLLIGFEEAEAGVVKVRPPGLPGMLVDELRIEGIIKTPEGILAFAQGRDNLSYIIRPGTKLYDGQVREILPDRVIFERQVNDPKQIRPYEEVVKELVK
jgi:hypothetical protein